MKLKLKIPSDSEVKSHKIVFEDVFEIVTSVQNHDDVAVKNLEVSINVAVVVLGAVCGAILSGRLKSKKFME